MRTSVKIGDITTVESGVIVQQVNAQRAMNSGVAKAIRQKYPEVYTQYVNADLRMGSVLFCPITDNLIVASIVGQYHYGRKTPPEKYTSYDALDQGFAEIATIVNKTMDIHYPLIGAGLGGGYWLIIREIINFRLLNQNHHLWLQTENSEPC